MEEMLAMCQNKGRESPLLEQNTREFLKSKEEFLMLVSPLDFEVLCWWIKRLVDAVVRKEGYLEPSTAFYFPWIELHFSSVLPEECFYTHILVLEEPFGNHVSLLEALLRRRIASKLKTVIFHSKQASDYVEALISFGLGRKVSLVSVSDRWSDII